MKKEYLLLSLFVMFALIINPVFGQKKSSKPSWKNIAGEHFLMGTAMNAAQIRGYDTIAIRLIKQHFNSIVAENCMKSAVIHPEENRFNFSESDAFVRFGEENDMAVIGHCLIWHSQLSPWFCVDEKGEKVSPEVLKKRMKNHIHTVVGRYKGRIKGWDVVNEAIEWDGSWRKTPFYEILGEEYIPLAFQYAHEADPEAELYYNDYGMDASGKRVKVVELVKMLKGRGLRIDAVGMQGHMGMDYPRYDDFEQSILRFGDAGVNVMITEWDMSALPSVYAEANADYTVLYQEKLNPYPEGLPGEIARAWNTRMKKFFEMFLAHANVITRVTVWGVSDSDSWKNNFPVKGRVDYPLLFDRQYLPKSFFDEFLKE